LNFRAFFTIALVVSLFVSIVNVPSRALLVSASVQTPLTPDQLRAAYNVNPLIRSGYTGKGVTVAVVTTNNDDKFYSDMKAFNRMYGLPDVDISVVKPYGLDNPKQMNREETGDVELVHAMAPDAKILLVVTATHPAPYAFSYVIDHNAADIATTSWYESFWDTGDGSSAKTVRSLNDDYANSVKEKITLITASGDLGSDESLTGFAAPGDGDSWHKHLPNAYVFPMYSPWVTQVGGTVLTLESGKYTETGWKGSGGGPSKLFSQPEWQTGLEVPKNNARNIPDIALNAACETPYAIYFNGSSNVMCGTIGAAPTFAGIVADIEQAAGERLGFLNPTLYSIASSDPSVYHEITSGCSLLQPNPNEKAAKTGYCAHAGWNFVTGWGSIDATKLATHLAPKAHIIPAATTTTTSREDTKQTNGKAFEYIPYIIAALVIAASVLLGFIYVRKRTAKNQGK